MDRLDKYQFNVEEGDIVEYKGKEYVVNSVYIDCCGHCLRVFMIKTGGCGKLHWAKELWDEQVNDLKVIKSWKKAKECVKSD